MVVPTQHASQPSMLFAQSAASIAVAVPSACGSSVRAGVLRWTMIRFIVGVSATAKRLKRQDENFTEDESFTENASGIQWFRSEIKSSIDAKKEVHSGAT